MEQDRDVKRPKLMVANRVDLFGILNVELDIMLLDAVFVSRILPLLLKFSHRPHLLPLLKLKLINNKQLQYPLLTHPLLVYLLLVHLLLAPLLLVHLLHKMKKVVMEEELVILGNLEIDLALLNKLRRDVKRLRLMDVNKVDSFGIPNVELDIMPLDVAFVLKIPPLLLKFNPKPLPLLLLKLRLISNKQLQYLLLTLLKKMIKVVMEEELVILGNLETDLDL